MALSRKEPKPRTPQELRGVLSKNLKTLVARESSVSAFCRKLGINRSQFNRYLSGQTFPQPDVLYRICTHFGVDARILHHPLDELTHTNDVTPSDPGDFDGFVACALNTDTATTREGYYRFLKPSPLDPGVATASLFRLRKVADGSIRVTTAIPLFGLGASSGVAPIPRWKERRLSGAVFRHPEGISFALASKSAKLLQFFYFAESVIPMRSIHTGYTAYSVTGMKRRAQVLPGILEYGGATFRDALRIRRRCGDFPYEDLTDFERDYFEHWEPLGPFSARRGGLHLVAVNGKNR